MGLLTLSSLERITCTRLTQECQLDLAPRLSLSLSLSLRHPPYSQFLRTVKKPPGSSPDVRPRKRSYYLDSKNDRNVTLEGKNTASLSTKMALFYWQ